MQLHDSTLLRQQATINGQWMDADDAAVHVVINPANGRTLASVPDMGAGETRRAIDAAAAAWRTWRSTTAKERAHLLRTWFDLILTHQDDLALLLTHEQGKPLAEARGEVLYGASFVEWFAEEAKRANGQIIPAPQGDKRILVLKQPVGVVAAITPWNFPIAMVTRKLAPALAAGCTVVLKPAEATPLCALALAWLAQCAGIPAGVINVITTARPAEVGAQLCENPIVRKLSFTGSTAVGKLLMAQCAGSVKRLSLELGGNAPFIVFDDADVDAAVRGALASKFRNAGQTCVCSNRLLVQSGIYAEFVQRLTAAVAVLKVGPGVEDGVQIGPLINATALAKLERLQADALAKGARVVVGGTRHALGGNFYAPTVLLDAQPGMALAQEEIFGPLAPIFRFHTEEEAITLANDTPYGLASYFYTRDAARIWRVAERLEYGMVGINEGLISNEVAPFGGIKQSGMGREGASQGMDEYLELKYLCQGGL